MFPIIPAGAAASYPTNDEGIFGFGGGAPSSSMTNLVSNTGVVSSDVTGVGTGRENLGACEFGGDQGIFMGGWSSISPSGNRGTSNIVSNTGVVATDVAAVTSIPRYGVKGCEYGEDKGIFFGGYGGPVVLCTAVTNLVSNSGVVQSDTAAVVGVSARQYIGMCEYGGDKGIIGFGNTCPTKVSTTNLISNSGVVATDVAGVVGVTIRQQLAACGYGGDKGIFGYGSTGSDVSMTNLVSNAGVVGTDVTGVGTARNLLAACEYGGDKGIFGYGCSGGYTAVTNLVTNAGVVGTDVTGVGTAREACAGCSFN